MKKFKLFTVALLLVCSFSFSAAAQKSETAKITPEAWLMSKGDHLIRALSENSTKTRYLKLRAITKDVFHQKELPRLAMGRYWGDLSPAQQEMLRTVFFDYFVVTYGSSSFGFENVKINVQEKQPSGKDVLLKTKVNVLFGEGGKTTVSGDESTSINTKTTDDRKADLEMFFALRETPNGYYIRDAKIEGQSILMFLRSRMEREYKSASYEPDRFLENMRQEVQSKYRAAETLAKMGK